MNLNLKELEHGIEVVMSSNPDANIVPTIIVHPTIMEGLRDLLV